MKKLTFKVAEFDAPLDLILHLLSKHKLEITDIDITSLLEQYMLHIQQWQRQDMEIASEFLEMASRLVYMKTVSLLPKHEEESDKLRQELTGQLVEYRLCKLVAGMLGSQDLSGELFVREPMPVLLDPTYTLCHPPGLLFQALEDALGKGARRLPPPRSSFDPIVERPVVSVTSKIFSVLRLLRRDGTTSLDSLLFSDPSRSGMVATFLAVLELVRTKKIMLEGENVRILPGPQPPLAD